MHSVLGLKVAFLRSTAALALASAASLPAAGDVILESQLRRVTADGPFASPETLVTDQGGPWDADVQSPPTGPFGCTAAQVSTVSFTRFAAQHAIFAADDVNGSSGSAASSFVSTFIVLAPAAYSITGNWHVSFSLLGVFPSAVIRLERLTPDPAIIEQTGFLGVGMQPPTSGGLSSVGVMSPGEYRLTASVSVTAFRNPGTISGSGSLDMEMLVPSPGSACVLAIAAMGSIRRRRA